MIAGHAVDFEGLPLVGVRVEAAESGNEASLDALPVLTDGDGAFRLEGLVGNAYDLRLAMGTVKARVLGVPVGKQDLAVRLARPQGFVVDARRHEQLRDGIGGLLCGRFLRGRLRRALRRMGPRPIRQTEGVGRRAGAAAG